MNDVFGTRVEVEILVDLSRFSLIEAFDFTPFPALILPPEEPSHDDGDSFCDGR